MAKENMVSGSQNEKQSKIVWRNFRLYVRKHFLRAWTLTEHISWSLQHQIARANGTDTSRQDTHCAWSGKPRSFCSCQHYFLWQERRLCMSRCLTTQHGVIYRAPPLELSLFRTGV